MNAVRILAAPGPNAQISLVATNVLVPEDFLVIPTLTDADLEQLHKLVNLNSLISFQPTFFKFEMFLFNSSETNMPKQFMWEKCSVSLNKQWHYMWV